MPSLKILQNIFLVALYVLQHFLIIRLSPNKVETTKKTIPTLLIERSAANELIRQVETQYLLAYMVIINLIGNNFFVSDDKSIQILALYQYSQVFILILPLTKIKLLRDSTLTASLIGVHMFIAFVSNLIQICF